MMAFDTGACCGGERGGYNMPVMAPERIRLTFDVSDRVRRALNTRASLRNISVGEVIEQLAEAGLSKELSLADQAIAEGVPPPKPKRGRKPSPD